MKVALDMDEVIVDFVGGIVTSINRDFGSSIRYEDITEWEMGKVLDPVVGRSWWDWLREHAWLWGQFPQVDGALGGIERLRAAGHDLEIVTSKPEWAEWTVYRWMGRYRPQVRRVIIVSVGESKADASDAELLIDDNLDNCTAWADTGRQAWLLDRAWNRHPDIEDIELLPPHVYRVADWGEIVRTLT